MTAQRFLAEVESLVVTIDDLLRAQRRHLVFAESCTGGLLAAQVTNHPGCSAWFRGSFVTYQVRAKQAMLGIPARLLEEHAPVSEVIAVEMAKRSLALTAADYGIAVTGLAGPEGDHTGVAVGTLWVAWASAHKEACRTANYHIDAQRDTFRAQTCAHALSGLVSVLTEEPDALTGVVE